MMETPKPEPEARKPNSVPPSVPRLRILLVDDNPDDRALIARELRREFGEVDIEEIRDVNAFAQRLVDGAFDVVVTDYQLHWTDGLFVLRAVKVRWPDKPVVMCTGTGSEMVAVAAMHSGLEDYVLKSPAQFKRLPLAVRNAVRANEQRVTAREAEARYRALFDEVPVGLFYATADGRVIDANPAMVKLLRYKDLSALVTASVSDFFVNPADRIRLQDLLEQDHTTATLELQVRRHDGTAFWARATARTARDPDGQPCGFEGSIVDITDEREVRRHSLDAERSATVTQIAGFLAHDLNTPLTNISLLASSVARITKDPAVKQRIEKIQTQRRLASELISDMMAVAKLRQVVAVEVDLRRVVGAALESVEIYRKAGVEVVSRLGDAPVLVRVDPLQIQEAIANVLKNAFQATSKGSVTVEIRCAQDKVSVVVTDTGPGIPEAVRGRLFEAFFTTKPRGEGTGLGLTLCHDVVRAHGGIIEVSSEPGKGAAFTILLPRNMPPPSAVH